MSRPKKVALTILLAVVYTLVVWHVRDYLREPSRIKSDGAFENGINVSSMREVFNDYDQAYFGGKMPKNVELSVEEHNPDFMGSTIKRGDGVFVIALNPDLVRAGRTARLVIQHEMCHVKVWDAEHKGFMVEDHGPLWRSCMLQLDMQGASRHVLIDYYEGD